MQGFDVPSAANTPKGQSEPFTHYALALLTLTIGVILWGAVVRATGAGAGCGDHWPLCNGEVVPLAPKTSTLIEFTHRLTSGLVWIATLAFWLTARKRFPKDSLARRGAALSFVFMCTEALVGAALVIFKMVADNPDVARGYWSALHLSNTFVLLFAIAITVRWSAGSGALVIRSIETRGVIACLFGLLLVGISGTIAALGDTLFPAHTIAEGLAQDLDANSHIFLKLRIWHPVLAVATAALCLFSVGGTIVSHGGNTKRLGVGALIIVCIQVGAGFLNVYLRAPIWLQIVHLLLADLLFVALVWLWSSLSDSISGQQVHIEG